MHGQLGTLVRSLAVGLMALALSACAHHSATQTEDVTSADPQRAQIVFTALQMVGVPYRYGGSNPDGFDCSGLVQYAYRSAGIRVPRTSREQLRASSPVKLDDASAGDLLFFRSKDNSHVGIYLGDGRFVHAPSTGRTVAIGSLGDSYYQRNLVQIGRFQITPNVARASCDDTAHSRC